MTSDGTAFSAFAAVWKPRIEQSLDQLLTPGQNHVAVLSDAMRYATLAPGKRVRPLLCLAAAAACGGDPTVALTAASAIEMVHAFSLVHDDLPCMDDDDLRRGKPTTHKVYGEAIALLAGDALLARAFRVLTEEYRGECAVQCAHVLSAATERMAEGQVLDMTAEKVASIDANFLDRLNAGKTGALLSASLELGAITAGGSSVQREALKAFGALVGLAFQIGDDLLDLTGTEAATGKRVGKDREKGKKTYPDVLGLDESGRRISSLLDEAQRNLDSFGSKAATLRDFAITLRDRWA